MLVPLFIYFFLQQYFTNSFHPDSKPRNKTIPTIPSNCHDLNEVGQTVNGLYLVQAGPLKNKIGVMFCSFEPETNDRKFPVYSFRKFLYCIIVGKFFGYVDVKSSGVLFFYVQRFSSKFRHMKTTEVVRFDYQKFNTRNAMNVTTGVFTAPVNGTYQFHFTGHKEVFHSSPDIMMTFLSVRIRLNGREVADSFTSAVGSALVSCHLSAHSKT